MLFLAVFQHIAEEDGEEVEHGGTVFRTYMEFDIKREVVVLFFKVGIVFHR